MAIAHGQSGALKSVLQFAESDIPQCGSLEDVERAIASLEGSKPNWQDDVSAEVQRYLNKLVEQFPMKEREAAGAVTAIQSRFQPELSRLGQSITALQSARFILQRWFNTYVRVPKIYRRMNWFQQELVRHSRPYRQSIADLRSQIERLRSRPQDEVARRISSRQDKLNRLQAIRSSPDFAGAHAECELAQMLNRQLDDHYHVFHDIRAERHRWMYDGHGHRRSAQIDHVVIGPGGVFVIETKCWSREFAREGHYYDPYEQVRWAGKILHLILSDFCGRKIRVRQVIATAGALPRKSDDSFAKVMRPEGVAGYIKWFKPELNDVLRAEIIGMLDRMQ